MPTCRGSAAKNKAQIGKPVRLADSVSDKWERHERAKPVSISRQEAHAIVRTMLKLMALGRPPHFGC